MEKIMCVNKDYISSVNADLSRGWKVKTIVPVIEPVSVSGCGCQTGAYVVLEKEGN